MANVNKVFLIGRLTADPELKYTPGGSAVTDLRMAVNRTYSTRDGDRREETLFIDVTVWARTAENCCQYLKKGGQVFIEGSLRMETWEDKNSGQQRSKIKVHADVVQFLDSARREGSDSGYDAGGEVEEPAGPRGRSAPAAAAPRATGGRPSPARAQEPDSRDVDEEPPGSSEPASNAAPPHLGKDIPF